MDFTNQKLALEQLSNLAQSDRHSVLIEGIDGCGKTYLAKQYATMLGIEDIVCVQPVVKDIRDLTDTCFNLENKLLVCIENLDSGVASASYTLLKFLEEPRSNIYVVVTCRNMHHVPDTIVSRSAVISLAVPSDSDIEQYAKQKDSIRYATLSKTKIWNPIRNFKDVDLVFTLTAQQLTYFNSSLLEAFTFNDNVTNIVWKLGHYEDKSETPLSFVIRYLMSEYATNRYIQQACIDCLDELEHARISPHAIVSKLVLDCKYGG